jgi:tetratricopeptide (TPR) repeat protein
LEIAFQPSDNASASELAIRYGYGEMKASRVPDDFLLPMQLVELGRKDELIDALLGETRDEYAARMPDLERFLNSGGYSYLREGDRAKAIRVFKLNTELFPDSYNVWDSLGEAYMEDGKEDLAILNYEKSLELNPQNENAKTMLRRLK